VVSDQFDALQLHGTIGCKKKLDRLGRKGASERQTATAAAIRKAMGSSGTEEEMAYRLLAIEMAIKESAGWTYRVLEIKKMIRELVGRKFKRAS